MAIQAKAIFNKVFVISTSNVKLFPKEEVDLSELSIIYVSTCDYRTLSKLNANKINCTEAYKSGYIKQFGVKLLNSFPFSFIIGEGGIMYIWSAYRKSKKIIKKDNVSHIYSSYRTMADHFIAYFLKKKYPYLHWTVDFRDLPFDQLYKNYVFKDLQIWILKKILKRTDLITTFSKGLSIGLKEYAKDNIHILPNGLFKSSKRSELIELSDKFTIQYTGSLFLEERNPVILFKAINELINEGTIDPCKFIIQYAGKDSLKWNIYIKEFKLGRLSIDLGYINSNEAFKLQCKAHINLLLSSSHKDYQGIFTGKFFEYISSGRPILAIINGVKDQELEEVFDKYRLGHLCYINNAGSNSIKEYISKVYKQWHQTGTFKWNVSPLIAEDFNWEKTGKIWSELIS